VLLDEGGVVVLEKWEPSGDKLEAGESPEDCVKWKIREELSLSVEEGVSVGRMGIRGDSGSVYSF
jgi:ADP-ribose pyrophosphatase YjhB (NUDIX family)